MPTKEEDAMGVDVTTAGAAGHPCSGGFSSPSFPLGWKPALTCLVAHTAIVFLLEVHTSLRHKRENRLCLHWVWASKGFTF